MTSSAEGECPVCREEYKTLKFLPCTHAICRDCLLSLLQEKGHRGVCSVCHESILDVNDLDLEKHDFDLAVVAFPTDHEAAALAEGYRSCPFCLESILDKNDLELHRNDIDLFVEAFASDFSVGASAEGCENLNDDHVCGVCKDADHVAMSFCKAVYCSMKLCQHCATSHSKCPAFKSHVTEQPSVLTAEPMAVAGQMTLRARLSELDTWSQTIDFATKINGNDLVESKESERARDVEKTPAKSLVLDGSAVSRVNSDTIGIESSIPTTRLVPQNLANAAEFTGNISGSAEESDARLSLIHI